MLDNFRSSCVGGFFGNVVVCAAFAEVQLKEKDHMSQSLGHRGLMQQRDCKGRANNDGGVVPMRKYVKKKHFSIDKK